MVAMRRAGEATVIVLAVVGCGPSDAQRVWCMQNENAYLLAYDDLGGAMARDMSFQIAAHEYISGTYGDDVGESYGLDSHGLERRAF